MVTRKPLDSLTDSSQSLSELWCEPDSDNVKIDDPVKSNFNRQTMVISTQQEFFVVFSAQVCGSDAFGFLVFRIRCMR